MASSGYLVPPSKDPSREKLWTETWKRIDRFLPELRGELALEDEEEEKVREPKESVEEMKPVVAAVPADDVKALVKDGGGE